MKTLKSCPFCGTKGKSINVWLYQRVCLAGVGVAGDMAEDAVWYSASIQCPLCQALIDENGPNKIEVVDKAIKDWNKRGKKELTRKK